MHFYFLGKTQSIAWILWKFPVKNLFSTMYPVSSFQKKKKNSGKFLTHLIFYWSWELQIIVANNWFETLWISCHEQILVYGSAYTYCQ